MDRGWHTGGLEARDQRVASVADQRVLRIDAGAVGSNRDRARAGRQIGEKLSVPPTDLLPLLELPFEALELRQHDRTLHRIHAAANTDPFIVIVAALPVHTDLAHRFGERVVIREERAAVAVTAKRLAWIKTGAADGRQVAALAALVVGTEALRRHLRSRRARGARRSR
jgi:hypothetical protein